ncbi:MAG: hypothetical protein AAF701_07195 [Pseudomonadota bacterium]
MAEIAVTEVRVKTDTYVIAAFYTADHAIAIDDLQAFAATGLARYKQPRIYQRVDALPRNPNGKLIRKDLPTLYGGPNGHP